MKDSKLSSVLSLNIFRPLVEEGYRQSTGHGFESRCARSFLHGVESHSNKDHTSFFLQTLT